MTPINKPEMIITGSVIIAIKPPNSVPTKPELVAIPRTKIKIFAIKIVEGINHNLFIIKLYHCAHSVTRLKMFKDYCCKQMFI